MVSSNHSVVAEKLSDEAEDHCRHSSSVNRLKISFSLIVLFNLAGAPHQAKGKLHYPSHFSNSCETSSDKHAV